MKPSPTVLPLDDEMQPMNEASSEITGHHEIPAPLHHEAMPEVVVEDVPEDGNGAPDNFAHIEPLAPPKPRSAFRGKRKLPFSLGVGFASPRLILGAALGALLIAGLAGLGWQVRTLGARIAKLSKLSAEIQGLKADVQKIQTENAAAARAVSAAASDQAEIKALSDRLGESERRLGVVEDAQKKPIAAAPPVETRKPASAKPSKAAKKTAAKKKSKR